MYLQKISLSYTLRPVFPPFMVPHKRWCQRPHIKSIISYAADLCDLAISDVVGPSQTQQHARCRYVIVHCVTALRPDMSTTQIGRYLGDRDHSTILNARKVALALRLHVPEFDDHCIEILAYFEGKRP
ncbi:helix-turn-helix domain-containing protein [Sphingorhabdus sp. 109]|uniref:helix-turn-helix domain-containing protein n=1 Tax=Sphingorhabdus sp. 109 TaxID=2653173 RepID=UPI0012F247B7|nr:helix-turn-helix domain-containing protein [Sphingorhabdus sp. 109]VWX62540.1 hypothetical protein SPHINGOR109_90012 [Sphingorhabdus sp. 109]